MNNRAMIAKWGFGNAPISSRMRERYDTAVHTVSNFMHGFPVETETVPAAISELKGMFNRCVRKDQWDYATVREELGNPPVSQAKRIASNLQELRRALIAPNAEAADTSKHQLERNGLFLYLDNYQTYSQRTCGVHAEGWIYVLSRREQPNILKVGMTERSVSERVKEINAATGIVFPFGARYVYRVSDAAKTERLVHQALDEYRIRSDREFFDVQPGKADSIIRECIKLHQLRYHTKGTLLWFDSRKHYGFISTAQYDDVFVHGSEVCKGDINDMLPGKLVEFILNKNKRGYFATKVVVGSQDSRS